MDLNTLNQWQQLTFCAAMCERSFPNYELFCDIEGQSSEPARKILNKVWEFLRGQLKSLKNMENQLETITDLIPDPDNYEQYGAYPAMDAMVNLQSCVQAILDKSIQDAATIQTLTHERLLEVLELQEIPAGESELWHRQQEFEKEVIGLITDKQSHAEIIKALIPMARDNGVSQLGISLED